MSRRIPIRANVDKHVLLSALRFTTCPTAIFNAQFGESHAPASEWSLLPCRESVRGSNMGFTTGCFVTVAFIDDISRIDLSSLVVKPAAGTAERSRRLPHRPDPAAVVQIRPVAYSPRNFAAELIDRPVRRPLKSKEYLVIVRV